MASASLKLSGITKRYPGVLALDHVDFECRPGEIHAVLGENGSGKSTLLGIASGATAPDEGHVTIMGKALAAADPLLARRLGLAIVYQDDLLVRELSVAENLVLGARDGAAPMSGKHAWAARMLAPYQLDIAPDTQVGQLTPAQRQFLEIVKALASNPKVLLLDEPTASLDVSGVEMLSAIVRRITAEGTAVVYVSHRLPEILALAHRVTILRDGVGQGTYEVNGTLSEADLIALMVGRPIEAEYPQRAADGARTGADRRRSRRTAASGICRSSCVQGKSLASPAPRATASVTRSAHSVALQPAAARSRVAAFRQLSSARPTRSPPASCRSAPTGRRS